MSVSPDEFDRGSGRHVDNRSAFLFRQPETPLPFDGERYVSGITGDIQTEHYHRYLFALRFCAGMDVLDIASGEGYGSALLGQVARSVIGVDLNQSAVDFANRAYLSQVVSFRQGSATDIPIETASIDVVVSFETLEHLTEHDRFFAEIVRVLRPSGLLVISSPNRPVYTGQLGNQNEFHLRELDRAEFVSLINNHFSNYRTLEQRAISGSAIFGSAEDRAQITGVEGFDSSDGLLFHRHRGVPNPPYFVAVASNGVLPNLTHSIMHSPLYLAHLEEVRRGLERERNEALAKLSEIEVAAAQITRLQAAFDEQASIANDRTEEITHLRAALAEQASVANDRAEEITHLRGALDEQASIANDRAEEIARLRGALDEQASITNDRAEEIARLREGLDQQIADAKKCAAEASELRATLETRERERIRSGVLLDTSRRAQAAVEASLQQANDQRIELKLELLHAKDSLAKIETSTFWRSTQTIRRLLAEHPVLRRYLRRLVKAAWWLITGRLLRKIREYRRARDGAAEPTGDATPHTQPIMKDALEEEPRGNINSIDEVPPSDRFRVPANGFEEVDPGILDTKIRSAKIVAFYLPQFHPIPENDAWWGKGFTEWRNVAAAQPWFVDHHQPRLPRDLGFYDLRVKETMREQIALAQAAGIFGFCFYYYFFNRKRILEAPVEMVLADKSIDFPFCIMWANENWTRRWDGLDSEILLQQDYRAEDDDALVDDLARHFEDTRYIQIGGRPLFILYRPGIIPAAAATIAGWRERFRRRHNLNPLIMMVQAFGSSDPREFGLDGAIEFPPHKVAAGLPAINHRIDRLNPAFHGTILDYMDVVAQSLAEKKAEYDLIRSVMPAWDNAPRRGALATVYHGSTPQNYQYWLEAMIDFSRRHPVRGESFVFVNAWNEWAEGAVLEPDLHWGGAYLNSTARALVRSRNSVPSGKPKLLIVGHDAYLHGAQLNCLALARYMAQSFGIDVTIILLEGGPLEGKYQAIAPTHVIHHDLDKLEALASEYHANGYRWAICNTVVTGRCTAVLDRAGYTVVSLVHEMPAFIRERQLEIEAQILAEHSVKIVFAAPYVRDQFVTVAALEMDKAVIEPQGLYQEIHADEGAPARLRTRLSIPADAIIVLNAGYGDLRKGIDLFIELADRVAGADDRFHFIWLGNLVDDLRQWLDRAGASAKARQHLHQIPFSPDIAEYFQAADIFALTSREDPFPSVVIEALAYGLPIVAFDEGGGYKEVVGQPGNGVLVPYLDVPAMAAMTRQLAFDPDWIGTEPRAQRSERALLRFDFRRFAFTMLRIFQPDLETVTVIVPNYNYEKYLARRLNTIFAQTYPIYEIIVLDDASTDGSLVKLDEIRQVTGRDLRVLPRTRNAGSIFKQWAVGVNLARGELIWIAEADDLSTPNFVETLAAEFVDPSLNLVFSDSRQIDENDALLAESYSFYYARHLPGLEVSVKLPAREFLQEFLSVRNPIMNVSSVLFRTGALSAALQASAALLATMRMAGDWIVYVMLAGQPGTVAYIARPLSTHRRHQASVTHSLDYATHLSEIKSVHCIISEMVESDSNRAAQTAYIEELEEQFNAHN